MDYNVPILKCREEAMKRSCARCGRMISNDGELRYSCNVYNQRIVEFDYHYGYYLDREAE